MVRMVGTKDARSLGKADHVVHDHRRFVAVDVGELKGLMIDQEKDTVLRCE